MPATTSTTLAAFIVLAVCFGMNMLARGVSETYAVFLLPLGEAFGWDRARLTGVYSVSMLCHGLAAPVAGILFDRLGPRLLYGLGLACLGGGHLLAGHLHALWQFYLCIGVLGGIGIAAAGMVLASALISRWFRGRLTTAMGVVYAGLGSGVLVIVPLTQVLIEAYGWRTAYRQLGGFLLVLLPFTLFLPWGRIAAGHPTYARERRAQLAGTGGWTLLRALTSSAFWALFIVFFLTAVAIYAVSLQAVAYLTAAGFSPIEAASAYGFTGMLSVVGMIASGWLADRYGRRRVVTLSYSCTMGGIGLLFLLGQLPSYGLLFAFVLLFGISQGSRGPVVSALTARLFPGGGIGAIYGAITMGMGTGAAFGSWLAGLLYDLTGGYTAGFVCAVLAAATGLAMFWLVPALGDADYLPGSTGSQ